MSYNEKHNEANGEENRDGNNDNLSWNCGAEGPSDDLAIESLRNRQVKNLLCLTLISIGAPMLLMGDEVRRTQQGNNNAYCQDNELSWFDWSLTAKNTDLLRFIQHLISLRLKRDTSQPENQMTLNELLGKNLITWHGTELDKPDWSDQSRSIAFNVISLTGNIQFHYILNAYHEALVFALPSLKTPKAWKRWLDTSLLSPDDIQPWSSATTVGGESYTVQPYSVVIFISYI